MGFTAAGISTSTVTTAAQGAQAPLGFKLTVPNGNLGNQEWTYIEAGSAFRIGMCACHANGAVPYTGTIVDAASQQPAKVYGIAQHAIASGSFGFVLSRGSGYFRSDGGAVSVNVIIQTSATGIEGCVVETALADGTSLGFVTTASATNATIDPDDATAVIGVALINTGP